MEMVRFVYASRDGQKWELVRNGQKIRVRHTANPAEGGYITDYELDAFLGREKGSAQNDALILLIGSLANGPSEN